MTMEYCTDEERSLTGSMFSRKPRGYGTATNQNDYTPPRKPTQMVTHEVSPDDTLRGLAVKYESNVADIKNVNKLWNDGTLILRKEVLIPVYGKLAEDPVCDKPDRSPTSYEESVTSSVSRKKPGVVLKDSQSATDLDISNNDFLSKYDTSLASIRKKVDKQVAQGKYLDIKDDSGDRPRSSSYNNVQCSDTSPASKTNSSSLTRLEDISLTPEPVFKSSVQRKIDTHKQRQDELFQL